MSIMPTESGWYLAHRWPTETSDMPPVVIRVALDKGGNVTTVWEIGKRDPSTLDQWRLVEKIHRDGRTTDVDIDRLQREAHANGLKEGREQAHREQVEYEAASDRERPIFPAWTDCPDFREVGEPIIAIHMRAEHAEKLSDMMSDLLCWARGFKAALGSDDYGREPMGIEAVRTIRETIKKAQRAAAGAKSRTAWSTSPRPNGASPNGSIRRSPTLSRSRTVPAASSSQTRPKSWNSLS